jgi:signal transduction histidine kinase
MRLRLLFLDKKILWVVLTTVFLSILASGGVDYLTFREVMKKKSSEISVLIGEGDELAVQGIIDELQSAYDRQIEVRTFDQETIKTHIYNSGVCLVNFNDEILNMGASMGSLSACVGVESLFLRGLTSRFFFLTFSLVQFFGLLYLVVTKSATERNLMSLIKYLESEDKKIRYVGRKSELFLKIEQLIGSREEALHAVVSARLSYERQKSIGDLAKQVAHDIRSPLMALDIALKDASGLSNERRGLIEQASSRIRSIAEDLLHKSKKPPVAFQEPDLDFAEHKSCEEFSVVPAVLRIISEKKMSFPQVLFEASGLEGEVLVPGCEGEF